MSSGRRRPGRFRGAPALTHRITRSAMALLIPRPMFVSGDADRNCNPLHARKMTARLQAANASQHPIFLDYSRFRGIPPCFLERADQALTDRMAFLVISCNCPCENGKDFAMSFLVLKAYLKLIYFDLYLARGISRLCTTSPQVCRPQESGALGFHRKDLLCRDMCIWYWKEAAVAYSDRAATACLLRRYGIPARWLLVRSRCRSSARLGRSRRPCGQRQTIHPGKLTQCSTGAETGLRRRRHTVSVQFGRWNFDGRSADRSICKSGGCSLLTPGRGGTYIKMALDSFSVPSIRPRNQGARRSRTSRLSVWSSPGRRLDNRAELIRDLRDYARHAIDRCFHRRGAYERWGTDCFAKLLGDWALSIWNPKTLADPCEGPHRTRHLYYSLDNDQVSWSTILDPLVLLAGKAFTLEKNILPAGCHFFRRLT